MRMKTGENTFSLISARPKTLFPYCCDCQSNQMAMLDVAYRQHPYSAHCFEAEISLEGSS
jgi:hypothetical protein